MRPSLDPRLDPSHPHYNPDPHAHPGLHIIALIEAVKGVLAVIAASGLAILGPAPLQHWVHVLIARFELDPQHGTLALFAAKISQGAVHWAAAAVMAYGVLHVFEAWGLWRAKVWASWLGCLAATLYLPIDLYALGKHPGAPTVAVLAINLLIVWVLARDIFRRRY
ncbi:DUF2127 domain-containing protein [Cognatiluteimonas profundi]|uniref:DUF2127 domain-containing protein n=1 Tax=Cognatiluteimonas profundi TaxID=2594501 RepID=UPI00131BE41B|nr:DUF2127 domain-containing protein [Lysobacter profundi]